MSERRKRRTRANRRKKGRKNERDNREKKEGENGRPLRNSSWEGSHKSLFSSEQAAPKFSAANSLRVCHERFRQWFSQCHDRGLATAMTELSLERLNFRQHTPWVCVCVRVCLCLYRIFLSSLSHSLSLACSLFVSFKKKKLCACPWSTILHWSINKYFVSFIYILEIFASVLFYECWLGNICVKKKICCTCSVRANICLLNSILIECILLIIFCTCCAIESRPPL